MLDILVSKLKSLLHSNKSVMMVTGVSLSECAVAVSFGCMLFIGIPPALKGCHCGLEDLSALLDSSDTN